MEKQKLKVGDDVKFASVKEGRIIDIQAEKAKLIIEVYLNDDISVAVTEWVDVEKLSFLED